MRRFLAWVGALVVSLLIVIVGAQQFGKQHTERLAAIIGSGYAAPSQACWYGVCPGRTNPQTALRVLADVAKANGARVVQDITLNEMGYLTPYDACITFMPPKWSPCLRPEYAIDSTLVRINVLGGRLYLSDMIAQLGVPAHIYLCGGVSPDYVPYGVGGVTVSVQYANGIGFNAFKVSKYNPPIYPMLAEEWRVSKDMQVSEIYFLKVQPYMSAVDNEVYFAWRGFAEGPTLRNNCGN